MNSNEKNCLPANNSNRQATPDCESVANRQTRFDFTKFDEFLTVEISPEELAKRLEKLNVESLRMALRIVTELNEYPDDGILDWTYHVGRLADLFKSM
jgi:hypothetical protein